jgi:hypothetical protein
MAVMMVSKAGSWLLDVRLSKYELQVSIDETFAALVRELAAIPERAWDARGPHGWSITDHVAHLAAWEALELARAERRTGTPEILGLWVEALRRRFSRGAHGEDAWMRLPGDPTRPSRAAGATLAAEDAWMRLQESHRRLVRALWDLPEAALRRTWNPASPTTLAADLATNTFEHYREHLAKIHEIAGHPA